MKRGVLKITLIEILLIIILFFALFASKIISRYILAASLILLMFILKRTYRIKSNEYIYGKQVNILMIIFGIVYILIFYALGLYFGFTKAKFLLSFWVLYQFIIPFTLIIVSTEYIRKILLSQDAFIVIKSHKFNLSLIFTYIIMILIDLVIYTGMYSLNSFDEIINILGLVLFSSLSCNLLYHYLTRRFGPLGIIYYRLITILFIYIIPVTPDVLIFIRSFFKMIYPFIIYLVLENTYAKSNLAVSYKIRKKNIFITAITLIILLLLVMIVSCQFKFGIVVIGSESMTGTIDKGDAVIYERLDRGNIKKGQVIVFDKRGLRTIHRVIDISNIDGEIRFITKGDANKDQDNGYILKSDIYGVVRLKIKYIGLPTVWLRSLFNK